MTARHSSKLNCFISLAEQCIAKSEPPHSTKEADDQISVNPTMWISSGGSEHTERLMAVQSAEILSMEDELKAFQKNWEKSFRDLQQRHKKEQERLFELDNFGYEM